MTRLLLIIGIIFFGVMMTRDFTKKRQGSMSAETEHWMLAANPIELPSTELPSTRNYLPDHPRGKYPVVVLGNNYSRPCKVSLLSLLYFPELGLNERCPG